MRVTFSLPVYWPAIGGCECLTHELVRLLSAREEIDVRVIARINDQGRKVRAPLWYNTTCYEDPKGVRYRESGAEVRMLGQGRVLRRVLYPFVRYHHRSPWLSTRVITGAFRRQFRVAADGCDVIHCIHNGLSWYGILSLECARASGAAFVFSPTLHLYREGWHGEMMAAIEEGREFRYLPELHLKPRGYHDRYWLRLCREADALVTWTSFEKDFLTGLGIPGEKILPLRLGPIISKGGGGVTLPQMPGAGDDDPVVLFLGRNHELKGVEEILRAAPEIWARFPETRFVFVGPKEGRTPEIYRTHADPRIVVVDRVSEAEKAAWIDRCDVFCVPSLHESFGIVFLEAWHHRKPIVAADIPPLRELNPEEGGGILIRPTVGEIAGAILRLLEDPSLRQRMGEWGRQRVDTRYRWADARDDLLGLYRALPGVRGASS